MAPENVDPPRLADDLPHLKDPALETWLRFLADSLFVVTEKTERIVPRVLVLEHRVKYLYLAAGIVGGVLFGHLGWK